MADIKVSFIGSAGIPNRYGGFESFLEHCAPVLKKSVCVVNVTCDLWLYRTENKKNFFGVKRIFIPVKANGIFSILHDLYAFLTVYFKSTHIIVMGVSGGLWFPIFYFLCCVKQKKLIVNIDGIEYRRKKYNKFNKNLLKIFNYLSQKFSHSIVYDNEGLLRHIFPFAKHRAFEISYSGDHVLHSKVNVSKRTALTICRIEPENNIEMLIKGAISSNLTNYTIVGNWENSLYGINLFRKYKKYSNLTLLHPIYDHMKLAEIRSACELYLHGHSVGGTNPSLIEIIFYNCKILCFDVAYNRYSVGDNAYYFNCENSLTLTINRALQLNYFLTEGRLNLRKRYTSVNISQEYLNLLK